METEQHHRRVTHETGGDSLVQQNLAEAQDINTIMARWLRGVVPQERPNATYGDFTSCSDFHDACNRVLAAQHEFNALPAELRAKCDNDPGKLLDMIFKPDNDAELTALGLLPEQIPAAAKPSAEKPPETPKP